MEPIGNYLKKFQKLVISADSTERAFREASELILKNDIGFFTLSQKGDILFIRASSSVKNAIILNKEKILKEFKMRSGLSFRTIN